MDTRINRRLWGNRGVFRRCRAATGVVLGSREACCGFYQAAFLMLDRLSALAWLARGRAAGGSCVGHFGQDEFGLGMDDAGKHRAR